MQLLKMKLVVMFVVLSLLTLPLSFVGRIAAAEKPEPRLYLISMGPGPADLVTLRAMGALKKADLVFCPVKMRKTFSSYLEGKEMGGANYWRLFPFYGKSLDELPTSERAEAQQLAAKRSEFVAKVRRAVADGKTVAILDNGDPMIYGPWEWCLEEFEDLHPQVVPGVSSFNAGNAALAKGVTTSDRTKAVILTSTDWPGKTDTIEQLSKHHSTMVVFTMRSEFPEFIRKLSINYAPDTPVAIVEYAGDSENQRVIRGTLKTILTQVGQRKLPFEYLIYVGDFLSHRYKKAVPQTR
jgi:precorrin-4/cobalt-precorrin-4 C11-methyltransferase